MRYLIVKPYVCFNYDIMSLLLQFAYHLPMFRSWFCQLYYFILTFINISIAKFWFVSLFFAPEIMPAKRKAVGKGKSSGTKRTRSEDIIHEVVQQVQPTIIQAVQKAIEAAMPRSNTAAAQNEERFEEDFHSDMNENDDDDLEIIFNKNAADKRSEGENTNNVHHGLSLRVPASIITRIKQNKYVKLGDLLNNSEEDITLNLTQDGSVVVKKQTKTSTITSFENWVSAFLVFATLHADQYPAESVEMFRYMSLVQDLAKTYGFRAAVKYDEDFRLLREKSGGSSCPWNILNQELYLLAAAKSIRQTSPIQSTHNFRSHQNNSQQCPFGFCFFYASRGKCTKSGCVYKHECYKCGGKHPGNSCKLTQNNQKLQFRNQPNFPAKK